MGNSLWATILYGDDAADAETKAIHQVLMLFLIPRQRLTPRRRWTSSG